MRKLFFLLAICILAPAGSSLAYDTNIAHPGIAGLTVDTYNELGVNAKISSEEKEWIKTGASQEDTPTRWVNHFYDPLSGVGFKSLALPSPLWSKDPNSQVNFSLGDKSWQRAISDYNAGNKEMAFKELGHLLHLLEDVSVPAHTRDDTHVYPGDGYENYVKDNWDTVSANIKNNLTYTEVDDLDQVFLDMAFFTNTRFFSNDTILNSKYEYPKIPADTSGYIIYKNVDGEEHKLVYVKKDPFSKHVDDEYILDHSVLSSYSQTLIPKAISYGAGLIDLFFSEAERLKNEQIAVPENRITWRGYANWVFGKLVEDAEYALAYLKTVDIAPLQYAAKASGGTVLLSASQMIEVAAPLASKLPTEQIQQKLTAVIAPPKLAAAQPAAPTQVLGIKESEPDPAPQGTANPSPTSPWKGEEANAAASPPSGTTGGATSYNPDSTSPSPPPSQGGDSDVTPSSTPEIPDTTPPTVPVITVADASTPASPNLHITLQSADASSSVVFYDLEYAIWAPPSTPPQEGGEATSTSGTANPLWSPLERGTGPSGELAMFDFAGNPGQSYIFRARAADASFNTSTWSSDLATSTPYRLDWSKIVVVNEIAWAGTSPGASSNEWLELYNNTNEPINFVSSTWQILIFNGTSTTTINLNKNIPAGGYYLLERTDDNTVPGVAYDQWFTGSINNNGARVVLKKDGIIIDEIDCSASWFAGSNATGLTYYPSMERKDSLKPGSLSTNWRSSEGIRFTPSFSMINIYGSPKLNNSAPIYLGSSQIENIRTLSPEYNPYLLSQYNIPAGKKLIIQPGVIIKAPFADSKINVYGELEAIGDAVNNIIFTSGRDNTFADEKMNVIYGNWTATTTPLAKDWQGIQLYAGANVNLNNVETRYAGAPFMPPGAGWFTPKVSQALRTDDATLNISNSVFKNNGDVAVVVSNATSTITNSSFFTGSHAISAESSRVEVANSSFEDFWNNNGPLYFHYNWPNLSGLTFTSTTFAGAHINAGNITGDATLTKEQNYLLTEPTVSPGASLNINSGVNIYLPQYSSININGALNAMGTAEEPIKFMPYPASVMWGNIVFLNSTSTMSHVILERGGVLPRSIPYRDAAVSLQNSDLTLQNARITNAREPGNAVSAYNSTLRANNSYFGRDSRNPLWTNTGIRAERGSLTADNNVFENLTYGIYGAGSPPPVCTIINTPPENFINVDTPVWP